MTRQRRDRAVSVTVNYAISLGITAILISLLLLSSGNLLEDQRERATREQLQNVGGKLAQEINYADELDDNNLDGSSGASVSAAIPDDISGLPYTVEIKPYQIGPDSSPTEAMIYLNTTVPPEESARIPLGNETAVVPANKDKVNLQTDQITIRLCEGNPSKPAYPDSGPSEGRLMIFEGSCP